MITRIFRVQIYPEKRAEFEPKFADISIKAVEAQEGFVSAELGKPSQWTPDEYVMISRWENKESLRKFIGNDWNEAHIPEGMAHYVKQCWIHHYVDYKIAQ